MITYVYVGAVDTSLLAEMVFADVFIVHEDYNATTLANDIALVQLRIGLVFSGKVLNILFYSDFVPQGNYYVLLDIIAPVALASNPLEAGVDITVSGWGQSSDGKMKELCVWT